MATSSSSRVGRPKGDSKQLSLSMAFARKRRGDEMVDASCFASESRSAHVSSYVDVSSIAHETAIGGASTHANLTIDVNVQVEDVNPNNVDAVGNALRCLNEVRGHYVAHHDAVQDYAGSKAKKAKGLRTFKEHWKTYYPWAYALHGADKQERIYCMYCIQFKMGNVFANVGSTVIQRPSLETHNKSKDHEKAAFMWSEREKQSMLPVNMHLQKMEHAEANKMIARVKVLLQVMYLIAIRDKPLSDFQKNVDELVFFGTPNVPIEQSYASYLSYSSSLLFLQACYAQLYERIQCDIVDSPFFSLMVDESTDVSNEHHMIVCVTYLSNKGNGSICNRFIKLLHTRNGTSLALFEALNEFLRDYGLAKSKLVGFSTDGCTVMTGSENGLVTCFAREVPHLVGVHCIAHRDALAAKDALSAFPIFDIVEKGAKKAFKWVNSSYKRHEEVKELANEFQLSVHGLLRMHDIRWLSRGEVTKRLVILMPILLRIWMRENRDLYVYFTSFKVQFFLHLLADVLHNLNILNKKFQVENIDITSIGTELVTTMDILEARFLIGEFGRGAHNMVNFSQQVIDGCLVFGGERHSLHIGNLGDKDNTCHLISWNACVHEGRAFVGKVIASLHARFHDLSLFEATKLFSPRDYPDDVRGIFNMGALWIKPLLEKFGNVVNSQACVLQYEEFMVKLKRYCPGKSMHMAWEFCGHDIEWEQSFGEMKKLWRACLVIVASTVNCERGFSKMNHIKSNERNRLSLENLNKLMFLSYNGSKDPREVDWDAIYLAWDSLKSHRDVEVRTME